MPIRYKQLHAPKMMHTIVVGLEDARIKVVLMNYPELGRLASLAPKEFGLPSSPTPRVCTAYTHSAYAKFVNTKVNSYS